MEIRLSDHFNYRKLIRFTLPSIGMMVFTSIYGVVDGFFVSNFAGKTQFAALNLIMPFLMILGTFGFMFGTGGSALVAKTMGEGNDREANRQFSLLVYVSLALGVILCVAGIILMRPMAILLGADESMVDHCVLYGRIVILTLPFLALQMEFQSFFITAEKPKLGLYATLAAGLTNMILDALFVGVFDWKLVGAASATAISQFVGGAFPLVYFVRRNTSRLKLCRTGWNGHTILKTCTNGSSEMMSNLSMSLVNMLYNFQLMKYAGENGIAAFGVLMYVCFVFLSIFIGYVVGTAPIISFHYGAQNHDELKNLLRRGAVIIGVISLAMLLLGEVCAGPLSSLYTGYDASLFDMTKRAFRIYSFSYLMAGYAIFGSSFFTALNDGLTSALISFLRTLVFQLAAVLLLPLIWGIDGIWFSMVAAELAAALTAAIFIFAKRNKYHYM